MLAAQVTPGKPDNPGYIFRSAGLRRKRMYAAKEEAVSLFLNELLIDNRRMKNE